MSYADLVNTVGVIFILAAFFLSVFKLIKNDSRIYFVTNLIGGSLACYGSVLIDSVPFMVLEGTWALVALVGLIKTIKVKA